MFVYIHFPVNADVGYRQSVYKLEHMYGSCLNVMRYTDVHASRRLIAMRYKYAYFTHFVIAQSVV